MERSRSSIPEKDHVLRGRYRLEKTIGRGSYGKVKLAWDVLEQRAVAIKFIARSSIKKAAHWTRIKREINLLKVLDHPGVVKLYECFETAVDIVLVMEFVEGRDLFDQIAGKGRLSEEEARVIFRQVVDGLDYLHCNRIVHRDLKPENIMLDSTLGVKLIDFGFATLYHPRNFLHTNCGSPLYASPEIVRGVKYCGPEVDCWSIGVVLYVMLVGALPFEDDVLKGLYQKICLGNFPLPDHLSTEALDLIKTLICIDPVTRLTMEQVKRHPWLGESLPAAASCKKNFLGEVDYQIAAKVQRDFGYSVDTILYDREGPARAVYDLLISRSLKEWTVISTTTTSSSQRAHIEGPDSTVLSKIADDSAAEGRKEERSEEAGNNFVVQAAATVMSRLKKLRDYAK